MDVKKQRLVGASSSLTIPVRVSSDTTFSPSVFMASAGNPFHGLLICFPRLVNPTLKAVQVKHAIIHNISTNGSPVFS